MYLTQQKESAMTLIKQYNSFEELNPTILNGFIGTEIIQINRAGTIAFKMDLKTKDRLLSFARDLI
jgi:5-methylthioribose kinase